MTETAELPRIWVDDDEPEEFRGIALEGPECGTDLAVAHLLVAFADPHSGEMFLREGDFCCHRHMPGKSELVPGHCDILLMYVQDGANKTCVTYVDGRAYVVPAPEGIIARLMAA